jgi:hypothetical protein
MENVYCSHKKIGLYGLHTALLLYLLIYLIKVTFPFLTKGVPLSLTASIV